MGDLAIPAHRGLRHLGFCGRRERCWRAACRREFGSYATVEVLRDGRWIAYCHGEAVYADQVRAEAWVFGGAA